MVFYFDKADEASKAFEAVRQISSEFHLQVSEVKSRLIDLPEEPSATWTYQLAQFKFPKTRKLYTYKHFFSLAFKLQRDNPGDLVLKYALQIVRPFNGKRNIEEIVIGDESEWNFLEAMLSQCLLSRPETLIVVHDIVNWYRKYRPGYCTNLQTLPKALNSLISGIPCEYDFEMSWAMWILKTIRKPLTRKACSTVVRSKSPVSILMALALKADGLAPTLNDKNFRKLVRSSDTKALLYHSPYWLLAYEAALSGWLGLDKSLFVGDKGFQKIANLGVRFFDPSRTIDDAEMDFGVSPRGMGGMAGDRYEP